MVRKPVRKQQPFIGNIGVAVIVVMAMAIAVPFSYDHNAQQAMDDASQFWSMFGTPIIGFDVAQVRQNAFSFARDLGGTVRVVDHGTTLSSPLLGMWNFITRGRVRTVADVLTWFDVPLTAKQATKLSLCTPLDALGTEREIVVTADPWQHGIASWYGPGFDGRLAASGETYSMYDTTAAHKTLPLGSLVRVVSQTTGKSVVVRINDRGPYVGGRIIDMSYQAKQDLGMGDLAQVYLERIDSRALRIDCQ